MKRRAKVRSPATAITRLLGFLALWIVAAGAGGVELLVGVVTAAAAAWASLVLLPPAARWPRPIALGRLVARFVRQSAIAGADVARRALDPALPLRPGFLRCPLDVPPGVARGAFCALSSLMPGTLVAGSEPSALCVHCLDVEQDVPAQMRADERLFLATAGGSDNA